MKQQPKVTVLMSVYNGEKYLREAVESILNQTFTDFEFLVINDGSTDSSAQTIKSYQDERIRFIDNKFNSGLQRILRQGVEMAKGEYIARMDADDISLPNRLAVQVKFMDMHKEIGICGSWAKTLGRNKDYVMKYYSDPEKVKANLIFSTSLAHPTVMIRRPMLLKNNLNYNQEAKEAEDYELWARAADHMAITNIPRVLARYRFHYESKFQKGIKDVRLQAAAVKKYLLKKIGLKIDDEQLNYYFSLVPVGNATVNEFLDKTEAWYLRIKEANNKIGYFDYTALQTVLANRWLSVCQANASGGLYVFRRCLSSPLIKPLAIKDIGPLIKILIKSTIKITG